MRYSKRQEEGNNDQAPDRRAGNLIADIPIVVWLVFILTTLTVIGNLKILGFHLSGWGWFVPLIASLFRIASRPNEIRFPVALWFPWVLVVVSYFVFSEYPSSQRTAQLLTPLAVGLAVSTYDYSEIVMQRILVICRYLALVIVGVVILKTGVLIFGRLPAITGFAAEVMTAGLLCTIYAASFTLGNRKDIFLWATLVFITIVAITRTAMVVNLLSLPLTLAPMTVRRRAALLAAVGAFGLFLFYTPRIQQKMFYSGRGEFSDIRTQDFRTTGRSYMGERFLSGVKRKPWFGHGVGSGEAYAWKITRGGVGYPHNDWLLLLYDYGVVGTSIFLFCTVAMAVATFRRARRASGSLQLFLYAGASSFIPLVLMMLTDNIIIYASFFGNLQCAILGVAYAVSKPERTKRQWPLKIRW